eukprot:6177897-Pleurochrysis_carterae.AAC.4
MGRAAPHCGTRVRGGGERDYSVLAHISAAGACSQVCCGLTIVGLGAIPGSGPRLVVLVQTLYRDVGKLFDHRRGGIVAHIGVSRDAGRRAVPRSVRERSTNFSGTQRRPFFLKLMSACTHVQDVSSS